jgi:hypothetical protein
MLQPPFHAQVRWIFPSKGSILAQLISTFHARINGGAVPRSFFAHILFFISVFLQKKKKKKKKEEEVETLHLLCFSSNPHQLSPSFFFLLCSPSFPFFPLLSLIERHSESERESERPWDGEKKLSRRPINRFSSSLCRYLSQKPNQAVKKQTFFFPV